MLIKNEPIEWDQLQDSLILTESEQKFAFCRTLLELKAHKMYVNTGIAVSSVVVTYTLGQYVNEKWKMFKRPYYVSAKLKTSVHFNSFHFVVFLWKITDQVLIVSNYWFDRVWHFWIGDRLLHISKRKVNR